ncbi:MAG: DUF481 domain-containing protein [Burkholderiales bacterium]|nr:DUF481 domain-containing protein [Burkholderiales bacterium]
MLRNAVPFLLSMSLATTAYAQTVPKPDGLWRGSLGAGLTATAGNTDSATVTINADAVRQTQRDKLGGYLQAIYGRQDVAGGTERTSDLLRGGATYNRDFNERRFGFGTLEIERNPLADLDLRSVVAGGIGYHLIRREGLTFDVSTGPAYTRERYSMETRSSLEWLFAEESTHALTPAVSFRQRLAYYPNLSESGEFRAVFDAGFVFKVTSSWNATVTLNNRYQSNPPPGVEKNDLLFVTGLQYVFNP